MLKASTDLLGGDAAGELRLYIALVRPLGYILATTLFFFLFMFLYGERKVLRMAVISAVFSVAALLSLYESLLCDAAPWQPVLRG